MGLILDIFCCFCCKSKAKQLEKAKNEKKEKMKRIEEITPDSRPEDKIWGTTDDPMTVKTDEMSTTYRIGPKERYKSAQEVLTIQGYRLEQMIGSGGYAKVHKAVHIRTGLLIACKKIRVPEKHRLEAFKDIKHELYILQKLQHPYVLRLIDHCIVIACGRYAEKMTLYMFMQFASGGDLSTHLRDRNQPFAEKDCKVWFAQLLSGMVYMHEKGIAHRDLKLANILLDEIKDVLISDFGLSRIVWRKVGDGTLLSTTYCGTPPYMAPELLEMKQKLRKNYNAFKTDVWAMGVILFKLINNDYPFPKDRKKALKRMAKKKYRFSADVKTTPELKDIIRKLFEPIADKRQTMAQISRHKWIDSVFRGLNESSGIKLTKSNQYFKEL